MVTERNPEYPEPLPRDARVGRVDPEALKEEEELEPFPSVEGGTIGGGNKPPVLTAVAGEFDEEDKNDLPELTEDEEKEYQDKLRSIWDTVSPVNLNRIEEELEDILKHTFLSPFAKDYIKKTGQNAFRSGQVPDEVLPLLLFDYFSIFRKGANLRQNEEVLLEHHTNETMQNPDNYDLTKEEEFGYNWQEEINRKYPSS